MPCSPSGKVQWLHIHALSERIDALASTLRVPDYEPLRDSPDMPFKFDDLVDFSGAVRFQVSTGTTSVTDQHLTDGVTQLMAYTLDPVLRQMSEDNNLYLVIEEDDCWCKSIFKVDVGTGVPRLKNIDVLGCCQSLEMPQPGDSLDVSQHVVPSTWAAYMASIGNQFTNSLWTVKFACVSETVLSGFRFESNEYGAPLTDCTRQVVEAKFTWPIRKSFMRELIDKLKFILECANSGGAKFNTVRTSRADPSKTLPEGCEVTLCRAILNLDYTGSIVSSKPGCLLTGCESESATLIYPWNTPTCGGETCPGGGPKVYCQTLKDLEKIIDYVENSLRTRTETEKCVPCDCLIGIDAETYTGAAEWCVYEWAGIGWVTGFFEERLYESAEGGSTCLERDELGFLDGIITSCAGAEEPEPCGLILHSTDTTCQDNEEITYIPVTFNDFAPPFTTLSDPPWVSMQEAAEVCYEGADMEVAGGLSFSALSSTGTSPVSPITQAAIAIRIGGRFRVRMVNTFSCSGMPEDIFTKINKTVITNSGTPVNSEIAITLSWDAGENTMVSDWILVPAPAWPDAPGDSSETYTIPPDVVLRCPTGCTKTT